MRRRVQKKRQEKLEKARLEERLSKIKEDRRSRREILALTSPQHTSPKKSDGSKKGESFFLTEAQDRMERQDAMNAINLDEDYCQSFNFLLYFCFALCDVKSSTWILNMQGLIFQENIDIKINQFTAPPACWGYRCC